MFQRVLVWRFEPVSRGKHFHACRIHLIAEQIRGAVTENLRHLSELRLHPSFPSTDAFLAACRDSNGSVRLLQSVDSDYEARIEKVKADLVKWRSERQPSATGSQAYDQASLCILLWIWNLTNSFRITPAYPFVTALLPEFFRMQEILDNEELKSTAQTVLASLAGLPYPAELASATLSTLIGLLRTSSSWRVRLDVLPVLQGRCRHLTRKSQSDSPFNSLLLSSAVSLRAELGQ